MNEQIEVLKMDTQQAIDFLYAIPIGYKLNPIDHDRFEKAVDVLAKALAEAENQEIGDYEIKAMLDDIEWYQQEQRKLIDRIKELEKKEWQSLNDDEIDDLWAESSKDVSGSIRLGYTTKQHYFYVLIEQALKEKNKC